MARQDRPAGAPSGPEIGARLIEIVEGPIDAPPAMAAVVSPGMGAVALFLGTVRDEHAGRRVLFLEYEAYRPMAEREMRAIADEMPATFGPCRVAIIHRVGRVEIGEASVVIAVASAHRRTALAACAEAIERLKKSVPIWKKEHFVDGTAWVEGDPAGGQGPGAGGGGAS
jgi:molybdopterin synthase catalytic subunit